MKRALLTMVLAVAAIGLLGADENKAGTEGKWSKPVSLVKEYGRLAVGNQVHVVGHVGKDLVYRTSKDHGATWSEPVVIAPAAGSIPMMYGGLDAAGDSVFLLTSESFVGPGARQLDFRRSDDNGKTWTKAVN